MEKLNKNKNKKNNVREQRLAVLGKGYQNPSIVSFSFDTNVSGDCSDMKSPCPCEGFVFPY